MINAHINCVTRAYNDTAADVSRTIRNSSLASCAKQNANNASNSVGGNAHAPEVIMIAAFPGAPALAAFTVSSGNTNNSGGR
jgi:hypothetical protein